MSRRAMILLAILFLAGAMVYLACAGGNGDDDDSSPAPTPPPGACADNTAPALNEMLLFPETSTVAATEFMEATPIYAFVGYSDAECNLRTGDIFMSLDGAEPQKARSLEEVPCSATAQDRQVGFDFMAVGVGEHQISAYVVDLCGAQSNTVSATFTLTPWEPDDDTADDDTIEPTLLEGEIGFTGDEDYASRPVHLYLFHEWLPHSLPVAWLEQTVPAEGFPFAYEWDMDDAGVEPGSYFLAAYLDAVDGDGPFNVAVDPVYSPYTVTEIVAGQTTTQNVTLVPPG